MNAQFALTTQAVLTQKLRGRLILGGLFVLSWLMQATHEAWYNHKPWVLALNYALGYSVGILPLIAIPAWIFWKVGGGHRGRFAITLAVAITMYSAYILINGR